MNKLFVTLYTCIIIPVCHAQQAMPYKDSTGKYGLKNEKGEIIVQPEYQFIDDFSGTLAVAVKDNKYGFMDKAGQIIIPLQYKYAFAFSEGLAAASSDNLFGYIDTTGTFIIPPKYDGANQFSEGLAYVNNWNKQALDGFIDKKGKIVIPGKNIIHRYSRKGAYSFHEGMTIVYACNGDAEECQYGYMNKAGKIVIPIKYWEANRFQDGLALVGYNSRYYLLNKAGGIVATLKYDRVADFSEGLAAVGVWKVIDGKDVTLWGFCDKTGKLIIPARYSEVDSFENGLVDVVLNGVKLKIDKTGKVIE